LAELSLRWSNIRGLQRFDEAIRALGNDLPRKVLNRAVNRAGDMAKTQITRALTQQTGLTRKVIVAAIKVKRSEWDGLTYKMTTKGGDVSLKFFDPKETDDGVRAKPFGKPTVFHQTFLSGGRWPDGRRGLIAGGHAFYRTSAARKPIDVADSGVIIPAEMVKGATADAFQSTVARVLPERVEHEIKRATKGVVS
jgi:hypothetical protein